MKKKGWEKRFANKINNELRVYAGEGLSENNRWIICGIKDAVYLLGECINKDIYAFANGFQRFCKDMEINFDLIRR